MKTNHWNVFLLCVIISILSSCTEKNKRKIIRLDGEWQVAKTNGELPDVYPSITSVPGLIDMASPSLDTIGSLYKDGWYWHKRKFSLENTDYDKIELKIFKARYYTKVYVNGRFAGENYYCFTPSYFDLKPLLLAPDKENEIIIGVGVKDNLPDTIPNGSDSEKVKYIPGIYDHVEITLSNKPYITNVQCVPDIRNEKLRVVAEIEPGESGQLKLTYNVRELVSKKAVISKTIYPEYKVEGDYYKVDFEIDMSGAILWTPENPFLYELDLRTTGDNKQLRFGMRSFRFDKERKIALLNDKPYYIKGTNVCIYRFFEDPERGRLPWDAGWPLTLHEKFKDMQWNTMRYCIGFPPERWYDIRDSLGFMLQDEFPIWRMRPTVKSRHIAEEFKRWMRERWNHPSVVIWDAQNELVSTETGPAIQEVRSLDLSNRPWENGWSDPIEEDDPIESHPYHFMKYRNKGTVEPEEGYKKNFFSAIRRPDNDVNAMSKKVRETGIMFENPVIINEYGWLWLNRDGTPTTLTDRVYDLFWDGSNLTTQERFYIYARHLAMLTEYWRAHRQAAGILHFCGLGYSRPNLPRGQTSDHWINIEDLVFEPYFYKYVKPSFSPVALMIDLWEKTYMKGENIEVPVFVINDLETVFDQEVKLNLILNDMIIETFKQKVSVGSYEVSVISFNIELPKNLGDYQLSAEIIYKDDKVFSLRDIPVK